MSATANTSANIAVCALGLLLALAIEPAHAQRTSAYHFLATTESYEPLAEATAVLEPNIDDSLSPAINIGFAFTFAGREYTQFQISSNGFVRLGADGTAPSFNNNLASTTLGPLLAPLWDDLKTGSDGEVRYALSGMAPNRILTVEFASMHWDLHSDSANANFQVKLHETTHEIAFVYGEMGPVNNTSGGSSIGLSNGQEGTADFLSVTPGDPPTSSGMVANNVIGSSEFLAEGTIYRFSTPLFANDMQVLSLDTPAPTENARMFVPFTPEVTFRNVGSVEQTDVPVVYEVLSKVQPIYQSTKTIASIVPGESVQITFDQVSGLRPGVYRILARVQLSADENKDNDLLMSKLLVNWGVTSVMISFRYRHTATLLPDGRILAVGGRGLADCELYDPATFTWTSTGSLNTPRQRHTATLLPDGKVLVVGGSGSDNQPVQSSELYDPVSGSWKTMPPMAQARQNHTASLLPNGTVLVAGGYPDDRFQPENALAGVELYAPVSGSWKALPSMHAPHAEHTATVLQNGSVLIVGGSPSLFNFNERYDLVTNAWSTTAPLQEGRRSHASLLLPNGNVFVVGGGGSGSDHLASVELYDPITDLWTMTAPLAEARRGPTATLFPDGKVLVVGGYNNSQNNNRSLASAELYDPEMDTWSSAGHLARPRRFHTANLLLDGTVLVAGGSRSDTGPWNSGEIFDYPAVLATPTEPRPTVPTTFQLAQNYPNPFNPVTTIRYDLSQPGRVTLTVYDILGRHVRTLVDAYQAVGRHEVPFDGSGLSSGVFFYQLHANNQVQTRKMLLIK